MPLRPPPGDPMTAIVFISACLLTAICLLVGAFVFFVFGAG
jgi:hypothetical protein